MKILAAPFEPPIAGRVIESADEARAESQPKSSGGPAPIEAVQTELNPATRESLSKLAILIRSQQLTDEEVAKRKKEEAEEKESAELRAAPKLTLIGEPKPAPDAVLGAETVFQSTFPHVDGARTALRAAARKRGLGVYRKAS